MGVVSVYSRSMGSDNWNPFLESRKSTKGLGPGGLGPGGLGF